MECGKKTDGGGDSREVQEACEREAPELQCEAAEKRGRFRFPYDDYYGEGDAGPEVSYIQYFLIRSGFLPKGGYMHGVYCGHTCEAVAHYQRFYALREDGVCGPVTKAALARPRCALHDVPPGVSSAYTSAAYTLPGCRYDRTSLTYAFYNYTFDLPVMTQRRIIARAFESWARVSSLRFYETARSRGENFKLSWQTGAHGDETVFRGPGNILAHAYFPPPCGGRNAGTLHFDDAERWTENGFFGGVSLQQVALHEIGHLLGLAHSSDPKSVMYAYYNPASYRLSQDDIAGVNALYGRTFSWF